MTKLGKILVLLNTAVSFFLMAWALSLLNNRVDWSDAKAKDDQPPGELAKRRARIDERWSTMRPAEAAWRAPRGVIVALEKQRPADLKWYSDEMQHLQTGASAAEPARAVTFEKGAPVLDPDPVDHSVAGEPVRGRLPRVRAVAQIPAVELSRDGAVNSQVELGQLVGHRCIVGSLEEVAGAIEAALQQDISTLTWMSDDTRKEALVKLRAAVARLSC